MAAIDAAPRTHAISHLIDELEQNAEHMPANVRDAARILDRYYAPTRYPDAIVRANCVLAFVETVLGRERQMPS